TGRGGPPGAVVYGRAVRRGRPGAGTLRGPGVSPTGAAEGHGRAGFLATPPGLPGAPPGLPRAAPGSPAVAPGSPARRPVARGARRVRGATRLARGMPC